MVSDKSYDSFTSLLIIQLYLTVVCRNETSPLDCLGRNLSACAAFVVWRQSATKKDSAYAAELERKLGTEEVSSVEVRQCLCCCLYHFAHFT